MSETSKPGFNSVTEAQADVPAGLESPAAAAAVAAAAYQAHPPTHADPPGATHEREEKQIEVSVPQFAQLHEGLRRDPNGTLDRFYDVRVKVWAELGRVELPIGELMQLGEGSVIKLSRPVNDHVDLIAQGVRLARGEVVVVDECFAVRITELEPRTRKAGA